MLNFRNKNRFLEELLIFLILGKCWLDHEGFNSTLWSSQEIVGHCFDLLTTLVTKSWSPSLSRNKEITDLRFKNLSLYSYSCICVHHICRNIFWY